MVGEPRFRIAKGGTVGPGDDESGFIIELGAKANFAVSGYVCCAEG